jgi:hypothetical protein
MPDLGGGPDDGSNSGMGEGGFAGDF